MRGPLRRGPHQPDLSSLLPPSWPTPTPGPVPHVPSQWALPILLLHLDELHSSVRTELEYRLLSEEPASWLLESVSLPPLSACPALSTPLPKYSSHCVVVTSLGLSPQLREGLKRQHHSWDPAQSLYSVNVCERNERVSEWT